METSESTQEILNSNDIPQEERKAVDQNNNFKFECEITGDKMRLGLKEIDTYSPYYYEKYFTMSDLIAINKMFKSCQDLAEVKEHIMKLFPDYKTKLVFSDDRKIIGIVFTMGYISKKIKVELKLEKKTIQDKDGALAKLFEIEKKYDIQMKNIIKAIQDEGNKALETKLNEILKQ